jgi:hypothetical protein
MHVWHAGQTLEKCILWAQLPGETRKFRIIRPNPLVHLARNEYLRRFCKVGFSVTAAPFAKLSKTLKSLKTPAQRERFSTSRVEDSADLSLAAGRGLAMGGRLIAVRNRVLR